MSVQISADRLLPAVEHLNGVSLHEGQIGFVSVRDRKAVDAGVLEPEFPVNPVALQRRLSPDVTGIALVGVGQSGQRLAHEWVEAFNDSSIGVRVSTAVGVIGDQQVDLLNGTNLGSTPFRDASLSALNAVGPLSHAEIYRRLLPLEESLRVDAGEQAKMIKVLGMQAVEMGPQDRVEMARLIAEDLATSQETTRDLPAVATLVGLMREPNVQSQVTIAAMQDLRVRDGLVRAARMSLTHQVASPVWVSAAAAMWVHGGDATGPIPTEVLAEVVKPHIGFSFEAAELHDNLVRGYSPEPFVRAAHDMQRQRRSAADAPALATSIERGFDRYPGNDQVLGFDR